MLQTQVSFVKSLPDQVIKSITWYTGGEYSDFNDSLRAGKIPTEKRHFDNISLAFQGVPPLTNPITVYKGKRSDNIYQVDKAFASTSLTIRGTQDFRGGKCCILQITVPPGSKVLPLESISDNKSEDEILLDRNGEYTVTGSDIRAITDQYGRQNDMKFIYVTYNPPAYHRVKKIDDVKDPGPSDVTLVQERMIKYLSSILEDMDPEDRELLFDFDTEIKYIAEKEKLNVSPQMSAAIKLRLGI
jgi:hypothetical protein